ncbi:MAG: membrane protein insertion efficiency factor YidD [Bacteroidetes bacterium]|nr:membrane protein insertion efficiency factor YidD [Bacteroidota bacterium]
MFKKIAIAFVKFYQYCLRPILPNSCRYTPSCSQYAIDSITKYGALKGSWMGLKRILRCNPWGGHGYDPVP